MSQPERQLAPGPVQISKIIELCRGLSDKDLTARLSRFGAIERGVSAVVVAHLAEFDERKLWLELRFSSLIAYCRIALGLSEYAAYKRIAAARAARDYPEILNRLACGRLHLCAVAMLAPHLTPENWEGLLDEAEGKSKRELEVMVATIAPRPDKKDVMQSLPEPGPRPADIPATAFVTEASPSPAPVPAPLAEARIRQRVEPLSPNRVHFGFTGSEELRAKVQRLRELMWHSDPEGRLEFILEKVIDFYLDRRDPGRRLARRERRAADSEGAASSEARSDGARSRYIPQPVKDEVWRRDGGRCAYLAADGGRCGERAGLEYDHVTPYALGGKSDDPANIRLLCRAHNQWEAERRGLPRPASA